jgi:D-xylulose reductase
MKPASVRLTRSAPPSPIPSPRQVRECRTEAVFRYAHMYPKAIALLDSGQIDVKPIITDHFKFEDSVKAFDYMLKPDARTIKSVIHFD